MHSVSTRQLCTVMVLQLTNSESARSTFKVKRRIWECWKVILSNILNDIIIMHSESWNQFTMDPTRWALNGQLIFFFFFMKILMQETHKCWWHSSVASKGDLPKNKRISKITATKSKHKKSYWGEITRKESECTQSRFKRWRWLTAYNRKWKYIP